MLDMTPFSGSGTSMRWDNEDRASGFMKDPFADATQKKLIHRASSVRTYNDHIDIQFRSLLNNCVYRGAVHKKRCCFQACLAQSLCNLLNLAMLAVEVFRKGLSGRLWVRFKLKDVWVRFYVM